MSMSFGLGIGLNTSQKLTPQMQQAIRLLAMSHLDLAQEVQLKLDSNPLLERIEEDVEDQLDDDVLSIDDWTNNDWQNKGTNDASFDDFDEPDVPDSFEKLSENQLDVDANDSDWGDVYDDFHSDTRSNAQDKGEFEPDFFGATHACIQDHVRWQMSFKHLSSTDRVIADYLIDAMDDEGFIRLSVDELCQNLTLMATFYGWEDEISPAEITAVLHNIQSCSPTGVGARDLTECLRIQLNELTRHNPDLPYSDEAYMVLGATSFLTTNNIKALMTATELTMDEVKGALALLRTLTPKPAADFDREYNNNEQSVEVPDILVVALDEKQGRLKKQPLSQVGDANAWRVTLNHDVLPNLQINQEYTNLIKKGDNSPDNLYLKEHLTDARLFLRSIDERNQNLLKVATAIVRRQQGFLQQGASAMVPMTLKSIADEIGLHESTVSRLTTNKTMLTPQGLFSLKYFFSSSVTSDEGDVSSTAISAQIREMIASENPKKPLSDAHITKVLEASGVNISRRTVTKYREAMGILSSTLRRQKL